MIIFSRKDIYQFPQATTLEYLQHLLEAILLFQISGEEPSIQTRMHNLLLSFLDLVQFSGP